MTLTKYHIEAVCDECGVNAPYVYGTKPGQEALFYLAADVKTWLKGQRINLRDVWQSQSNSDHNEVIDGLLAQLEEPS